MKIRHTAGRLSLALLISASLATGAQAIAPDFMAKLNSPDRPAEDKARDEARKPAQVMAELGVQEGWTMVDVAAGGGWYTEVLSAAVGPTGKVLMQVGARAGEAQDAKAARLGNVEVIKVNMNEMNAGVADAAVTALNLHDAFNFRGEDGGTAFVQDIYNVLKPGGVAAIIDHEGTAGLNNADLHRIPAAEARRLLEKVGFEIVKESMVLDNPDDDHSMSVREDSLARNTDRFLFIVRKP